MKVNCFAPAEWKLAEVKVILLCWLLGNSLGNGISEVDYLSDRPIDPGV